jgi:hypothetical protein
VRRHDVNVVHGDISALLAAGVLNRTAQGQIEFEFAFDSVKVEFMPQYA